MLHPFIGTQQEPESAANAVKMVDVKPEQQLMDSF
jgi:hypothetical protein